MTVLTRPSVFALALLLAATGAVSSPHAQEPVGELPQSQDGAASAPAAGESASGTEATSVRPSEAPFMKPLGRLSTILGSVHFLRRLCGDAQADVWRQKMNDLIVAQKPNDADRRILVASFNSGFRAFESTYRECTPAADVAARRYLEEGAVLSREISARYGN